MLQHSA